MGSKNRLLPWIHSVLNTLDFETVADPFSGSGCVAYLLKRMGKLHAAARHPGVLGLAHKERHIRRHGVPGFVELYFITVNFARRDQRLRFGAVLSKSALHQHAVDAGLLEGRSSGSAVETLPVAKSDESRARLLTVIQHDVKRLDRLITDISDASRLDAELQRQEAAPVDLAKLLNTLTTVANEVKRDDGVRVTLKFEGGAMRAFQVPGHDSRLGQIIDNLIENACSFSPPNGTVRITCRRLKTQV